MIDETIETAIKASRRQLDTVITLMESHEIDGEISVRIISAYVLIAIQHYDSICTLIENNKFISASALSRPLVEASIRTTWLTLNEDHKLVKKAISQLEKGRDDFPVNKIMYKMIDQHFGDDVLTSKLKGEMQALNSYTHGGHYMISRCLSENTVGPNFAHEELIGMLKGASYYMLLSVLAYASKTDNSELATKMNQEIKILLNN